MSNLSVTRQTRMLSRAARDPGWVLKDRRCAKPEFCEQFFEICEDKMLQEPDDALEHAQIAEHLARKIGDPHLIHRAQGVVVHAWVCMKERGTAERLLDDYRLSAFTCCKACSGDWLRRRAELLSESADGPGTCELVERSRRELGDALDADLDARLRFVEAIGHAFQRDHDRALASVGDALRDLDLSSPRGYFLDSLAFVGLYLTNTAELRHFRVAEGLLVEFQERLKGLEGWTDVRVRKSWVEGHVFGGLGDWRKAADRLETARCALLKTGPTRHAVAATLDLCQVHSRRVNDVSSRAIRRMLSICRRRRDLDRDLRSKLKELAQRVSWYPEKTLVTVAAVRSSITVPVPALLATRELWRLISPVSTKRGEN